MKDAGTYFHEYCQGVNDLQVLLKLNYYFSKFNNLNNQDLTQFIRAIVPHKKVGFDNISQYKDNTFNSEDLQYGLLKVLEQLVLSEFDMSLQQPSIFYWIKNDEYFYPTAIHLAPSGAEALCSNMIEASIDDDVNFLYESGKLINQDINTESIFSSFVVGPHATFDLEGEYKEGLDYNRINRFKSVSLISLDKAKEAINVKLS